MQDKVNDFLVGRRDAQELTTQEKMGAPTTFLKKTQGMLCTANISHS
jgi:hypothetical protein